MIFVTSSFMSPLLHRPPPKVEFTAHPSAIFKCANAAWKIFLWCIIHHAVSHAHYCGRHVFENSYQLYHTNLDKTGPTQNIPPVDIRMAFLLFFLKRLSWTSHRWLSAAAETEGLNATQTGDQRGCYKGLHRGG